jgi:hypothetical protein
MVIWSGARSVNVCVCFSELNSLIIHNLFCFLLHIGKHDKFRHLALMSYVWTCSELRTLQWSLLFDDFIGSPRSWHKGKHRFRLISVVAAEPEADGRDQASIYAAWRTRHNSFSSQLDGSRTRCQLQPQRKNFSHSQQQIGEAEVADVGGMSSPMRTFGATAISTAMSSLRIPEQAQAATLAHVSRPRSRMDSPPAIFCSSTSSCATTGELWVARSWGPSGRLKSSRTRRPLARMAAAQLKLTETATGPARCRDELRRSLVFPEPAMRFLRRPWSPKLQASPAEDITQEFQANDHNVHGTMAKHRAAPMMGSPAAMAEARGRCCRPSWTRTLFHQARCQEHGVIAGATRVQCHWRPCWTWFSYRSCSLSDKLLCDSCCISGYMDFLFRYKSRLIDKCMLYLINTIPPSQIYCL